MSGHGWCTIESDPGVFTELIQTVGVKGVQFEELFDMDDASFDRLKPIYGLIFLFKWDKDIKDDKPVLKDGAPGVFFMNQVINNACATQAIVSILLNRPDIDVGDDLKMFKEFTTGLPPQMIGEQLDSMETIKTAHNSFARAEPFVFEEKQPKSSEDDEAFHFVGYVPVNGHLYELDGLKRGPVLVGECTLDNWLAVARPAIESRIQQYSQKEIRFNLLALCQDRVQLLDKQLAAVNEQKNAVTDTSLLSELNSEAKRIQEDLDTEHHKRQQWADENVRRKHNYVPMVFQLLKHLAQKDQLLPLVEQAKKARADKRAAAVAKKEKEKASKGSEKAPMQTDA